MRQALCVSLVKHTDSSCRPRSGPSMRTASCLRSPGSPGAHGSPFFTALLRGCGQHGSASGQPLAPRTLAFLPPSSLTCTLDRPKPPTSQFLHRRALQEKSPPTWSWGTLHALQATHERLSPKDRALRALSFFERKPTPTSSCFLSVYKCPPFLPTSSAPGGAAANPRDSGFSILLWSWTCLLLPLPLSGLQRKAGSLLLSEGFPGQPVCVCPVPSPS